MQPITSIGPPGANGTTIVMGFIGLRRPLMRDFRVGASEGVAGSGLSAPEILEPGRFRVPHHVLNVLVPEVSLQRPGIVPFIGQSKAAGVPEHVGMGRKTKLGLDT